MSFLRNQMDGFKYAIEGVVHVVRTQRHMRAHFLVLGLVLVVSLAFDLARWEILMLLLTVSLVLVAEMFNTAVEAVVDMVTQTHHPLAKFAKDIAAGAVLITAINALAVAFLLFSPRMGAFPDEMRLQPPKWPTIVTVALILLATLGTMWKLAGGKGKLWRGGVVSGHAAIGFFLATTILFVPNKVAVGIMAYIIAILLAQSRVEGGIHTLREVVTGALLATGVALVVYLLLSPPV